MSERALLRLAEANDIPAIMALEHSAHAIPFVGQWSEERHRSTMASRDSRYYVTGANTGELAAYAILRGLDEDSGSVGLKRIVVGEPGRGLGRRVLEELLEIAFEDLHAHRVFLDVFEDNDRARRLYESIGFSYEGTLREAARRNGSWCNLLLMSILQSEHKALNSGKNGL